MGRYCTARKSQLLWVRCLALYWFPKHRQVYLQLLPSKTKRNCLWGEGVVEATFGSSLGLLLIQIQGPVLIELSDVYESLGTEFRYARQVPY